MKLFNHINRMHSASLVPFIFSSVFIVLSESLNLISSRVSFADEILLYNYSSLLNVLIGYVFCYFITFELTSGKRAFNAFWSILCLSLYNTAVYSFYDNSEQIYFIGIIMALLCVFCFKRIDRITALALTVISAVVFGFLAGFACDYFDNFIMWLSACISDKGCFSAVFFSAFDNILSLFGIDTLKDMFFYKSYGGSLLFEGDLVTGAKDLFSSGYGGKAVSSYLSGHYFLLFSLAGIAAAMSNNIKGVQKYILYTVTVAAVLSGNISILLLFIFLESPFLFLAVLFIGAAAYLTAFLLNLGMGYLISGGIAEMIMYINKPVYLFAGGVIFLAIGYFVYKYCYEKHGISDSFNIYIPTRLEPFVKALGGINNIIRYKNDALEVRNPKLVDTVSINCEINENIVEFDDKRIDELMEYL